MLILMQFQSGNQSVEQQCVCFCVFEWEKRGGGSFLKFRIGFILNQSSLYLRESNFMNIELINTNKS